MSRKFFLFNIQALVDMLPFKEAALVETLSQFRIQSNTVRARVRDQTPEQIISEVADENGHDAGFISTYIATMLEAYDREFQTAIKKAHKGDYLSRRITPGTLDLIAALQRQSNVYLGVFADGHTTTQAQVLDLTGLRKSFVIPPSVYTRREWNQAHLIENAIISCQTMFINGGSPLETILVSNTPSDLKLIRYLQDEHDIRFVAVANSGDTSEELEKRFGGVEGRPLLETLDSFRDVPGFLKLTGVVSEEPRIATDWAVPRDAETVPHPGREGSDHLYVMQKRDLETLLGGLTYDVLAGMPDGNILDAGCGDGLASVVAYKLNILLAEKGVPNLLEGRRIVGVDYNRRKIKESRKNYRSVREFLKSVPAKLKTAKARLENLSESGDRRALELRIQTMEALQGQSLPSSAFIEADVLDLSLARASSIQGRDPNIEEPNIRKYLREGSYAAVLMNNVIHWLKPEERPVAIQRVYDLTKPRGVLLINAARKVNEKFLLAYQHVILALGEYSDTNKDGYCPALYRENPVGCMELEELRGMVEKAGWKVASSRLEEQVVEFESPEAFVDTIKNYGMEEFLKCLPRAHDDKDFRDMIWNLIVDQFLEATSAGNGPMRHRYQTVHCIATKPY